jgi:hypothetical protein
VTPRPLIVACGALANELRDVLRLDGLESHVEVAYLPANLHNTPDRIVAALDAAVAARDGDHRRVLVAYADCGTGGALDRWLEEHPTATRLPGAHCYDVYAGAQRFASLHDAEPGTFYLTDFLAKHFDALVWSGLGLDRHPQLRDVYFANYRRVVLLSQTDRADVIDLAAAAADRLGLAFHHEHVGTGDLGPAVVSLAVRPPTRSVA